jgi:hypothetical protein
MPIHPRSAPKADDPADESPGTEPLPLIVAVDVEGVAIRTALPGAG